MPEESEAQTPSRRSMWVLIVLAALAVALGTYARFKGLGKWPFDVDEFYTARTVENILRSGLPEYLCGGFYMRALLVTYLGAFLQYIGLGPEFSLRLIAVVSSLIALPAAYLISLRVQGHRVLGVLVVTILALSVWEVEMARFARMYTPFQAVFLWYVVYFLRYAVDKEAKAVWPMVILSLVGALVWEGGVFLAATNLLPPLLNQDAGRLKGLNWRYIVCAALLVGPLYMLATNNMRISGEDPFPAGFIDQIFVKKVMGHTIGVQPWRTLLAHPVWALGALIPVAAAVWAAKWIFSLRDRWIAVAGLLVALAAALLHQFMLSIGVLLILMLLGTISLREMFSRAALPFWVTLAVAAVFWIVYALIVSDWKFASEGGSTLFLLLYEFVRFPDVLAEVALPWARAVPRLSLVLFVLLSLAFIRALLAPTRPRSTEQVLLLILVCLVLAACASNPPRHETRYVFFLYPVAIIIALAELMRLVEMLTRSMQAQRLAPYGAAIAALALFGGTEDIDLRHLRYVDSADVNFRVGMRGPLAAHYEPRHNVRAAADWLAANTTDADVVINSFQGLDFYSKRIDYFFLDWTDRRFTGWSCKNGTVERWDNTPLIYTVQTLQSKFATPQRVFYIADDRELEDVLVHLQEWRPRVVWQQDRIAVVGFDRTGRPQQSSSTDSVVRVASR